MGRSWQTPLSCRLVATARRVSTPATPPTLSSTSTAISCAARSRRAQLLCADSLPAQVDTRNANSALGRPTMGGGHDEGFPAVRRACALPERPGAQAHSLNSDKVVPQGALSYLSTWPAGGTQPVVSTLNALKGRSWRNAAIVPAGGAGAISVYVTNTTGRGHRYKRLLRALTRCFTSGAVILEPEWRGRSTDTAAPELTVLLWRHNSHARRIRSACCAESSPSIRSRITEGPSDQVRARCAWKS